MYRWILTILIIATAIITPLTIRAQEQEDIQFTATINPRVQDLELNITADKPQSTVLAKGEIVTFTVSYRSLVQSSNGAAYPLTLIAYWEEGTFSGGGSVDVYDYVINSATNAHDGSPPIIDLTNKRITWNIPNLAYSSTANEVSFQLKVKESLSSTNIIDVYTYTEATFGDAAVGPDSYLLKIQAVVPSATPTFTPAPTSIPTPNLSVTMLPGQVTPTGISPSVSLYTPTPISSGFPPELDLRFETVSIPFVSSTRAVIEFETNLETTATIFYDLCDNKDYSLVQSLSEKSNKHTVELKDLLPNTVYCFTIQIQSLENNKTLTSDIFTFQTADKGSLQDLQDITVHSSMVPLIARENDHIIVPRDVLLTISFNMENDLKVDRIYGFFEHQDVQGISTLYNANVQQADFIEISSRIFSTEIIAPSVLGKQLFYIHLTTQNGNLLEQQIPYTFQIVDPLTVLNKENGEPIQHAYVKIFRLEESTGEYREYNESFRINQFGWDFFLPYYTNEKGELPIALPQGTYRFEVNTIRYQKGIVDWEINPENARYPVIELHPQFSLVNLFTFISFAFLTFWKVFLFILEEFISAKLVHVVALVLELLLFLGFIVGVILKIFLMKPLHKRKYHSVRSVLEEIYHLYFAGLIVSNGILAVLTSIFLSLSQALPYAVLFFISVCIFAIVYILEHRKYEHIIN